MGGNVNAIGEIAPFHRSAEHGISAPPFEPTARSRILVLAAIISLHVALVIYVTMFRPAPIKPAEVPQVLMANIIAEPKPIPPSPPMPAAPLMEPVVKPVVKPVLKPVLKPIAKPLQPAPPKPALQPRIDTPPVTEAKTSTPMAAAEPSPAAPATAAPAPPPVTTAPPAQPAALTPPRFNAAYLNNPPPTYPVMARRLGEEGKVMLRVLVTPEGTAAEVRIQNSSGSPMFDDAALEAVRQWRFVPARQGDNPVAAWVQVPIVFRLT